MPCRKALLPPSLHIWGLSLQLYPPSVRTCLFLCLAHHSAALPPQPPPQGKPSNCPEASPASQSVSWRTCDLSHPGSTLLPVLGTGKQRRCKEHYPQTATEVLMSAHRRIRMPCLPASRDWTHETTAFDCDQMQRASYGRNQDVRGTETSLSRP